MGTIYIEEYGSIGCEANRDAPISDLNTLLGLTKDATTSSTAESITLTEGTRQVTLYAAEDHRVCITSDTSATKYAFLPGAVFRSFGVEPGDTLYYELDA